MKKRYFKDIVWWVIFLLFNFFGFIVGVGIGYINPLDSTFNINPTEINFISIFLNNYLFSLTLLVSGILTCGTFPLILLIFNGYIVGLLLKNVVLVHGFMLILEGLGPHFIPEILAFLLSAAIGNYIAFHFIKFLKNGEYYYDKSQLRNLIMFYTVSIAFLVLAAFLEAKISKVII